MKSSAYSIGMHKGIISLAMSLMATRKSVMDIVEHCGTPFSWKKMSERVLEVLTWKVR